MHAAVRTSVLSGATLLTAGAIALAPVQPLPSTQQISHAIAAAEVQLTSAFDIYGQVFAASVANLQTDINSYFSNGLFPILRQLTINQVTSITDIVDAIGDTGQATLSALFQQTPTYLKNALTDLELGKVSSAIGNVDLAIVTPIVTALTPLGEIPTAIARALAQPLTSITNLVTDSPTILADAVQALASPLVGGLGGAGVVLQNVISAVKAGSLAQLATAIIQAPAVFLNGVFNGGAGHIPAALLADSSQGTLTGGLFGGGQGADGVYTVPGTLQSLIAMGQTILNDISSRQKVRMAAMAPTASAAPAAASAAPAAAVASAAAIPSTHATTVTLSATAAANSRTRADHAAALSAAHQDDHVRSGSSASGSAGTKSKTAHAGSKTKSHHGA